MTAGTVAVELPLVSRIALTAATRPDADALVLAGLPDGDRVTTYAQLADRVDALAAGFRSLGLTGDRAAVLVPPGPDFFATVFGLVAAGVVPVLVDPGIGLRTVGRCLGEAAPRAFVGVPRAHAARRALGWCPRARIPVVVGRRTPGAGRTLAEVESAGRALLPVRRTPPHPDTLALIAFTSGSTGVPKGVEYRHRHLAAQLGILRELYGIAPGDVSLATFPPFALIGPLLGLTTVVPRMDPTRPARADPRGIVAAVNAHTATLMFASPALLDTLGRWGERSGARMPSLRRVVSAGAPVSRRVQRRVLAMLGPDAEVFTPYGATEALPVTSIGSGELSTLPDAGICVGRPVPGVDLAVVRVSDDPLATMGDAHRLPPGRIGEIVVRGPVVTDGYANRPEATARAKLAWDGRVGHRMGDAGYLDDAGRLWFCGRVGHRVTTPAGELFSVPCEEVFNAHPAVARSALVGVGVPGRQRPVLWVQLEAGVHPSTELTRSLLDRAAGNPLTRQIRTVLYRRDLPVDRRHNAKIDRTALAADANRRLTRRRRGRWTRA